ncbi:uncharacterized protein A4U43_C03F23970 [Asparagus officinalis]|uniref:Uncharacterized protein n=1 Tax=Asparagus officinalis TaxID=4686 RepID=A0A5P1FCH1_ASPOF|nr:uncharacterized protein A4U43_C03F23970 [Asparagus officinalis]
MHATLTNKYDSVKMGFFKHDGGFRQEGLYGVIIMGLHSGSVQVDATMNKVSVVPNIFGKHFADAKGQYHEKDARVPDDEPEPDTSSKATPMSILVVSVLTVSSAVTSIVKELEPSIIMVVSPALVPISTAERKLIVHESSEEDDDLPISPISEGVGRIIPPSSEPPF